DRFQLLTGGSRTAMPRQQTLRALMDWSYDLLSPQEKTLLHRLSVFVGGGTLAAVEAITKDEGGRMKDESDPIHPSSFIPHPFAQAALRLCGALWYFWYVRGHHSEGRSWCARALAMSDGRERTLERARALNAAGCLAHQQGDYPQ